MLYNSDTEHGKLTVSYGESFFLDYRVKKYTAADFYHTNNCTSLIGKWEANVSQLMTEV